MTVTADELKANLEKTLSLVQKEDIDITLDGRVVARLTSPCKERLAIAESLFGIIPADASLEEARDERLSRI